MPGHKAASWRQEKIDAGYEFCACGKSFEFPKTWDRLRDRGLLDGMTDHRPSRLGGRCLDKPLCTRQSTARRSRSSRR